MMGNFIVIVDDNRDYRDLCAQALELRGHRVKCFEYAKDALSYLETDQEKPSLVLADLLMPGMDGSEFIRNVRQNSALNAIKIIITSGWTNLKSKAAEVGADSFLSKPFDLNDLYALVEGAPEQRLPPRSVR